MLWCKVTARCGCNNLKKDWRCQDALTAYRKAGRDPKDITKSQFGIGLIPCNEECRSKVKVVEPVPHLRKAKVTQVILLTKDILVSLERKLAIVHLFLFLRTNWNILFYTAWIWFINAGRFITTSAPGTCNA